MLFGNNKIILKIAFISFRLLLLLLCGICAAASNQTIQIDVLHTTDVHGNVFGSGIDARHKTTGGLLRCATLVNEIRQSHTNVVLIDCGDLFQGAVESFLTQGQIVAEAVAAMRYDALIIGNHEFDQGVAFLTNFYNQLKIDVLAADVFVNHALNGQNIVADLSQIKLLKQPDYVQPFLVYNFDGIRLVIIGLSNPHMPCWFRKPQLGSFQFADSVMALRQIMPEVRLMKPDAIILALHQGYRNWGDNAANRVNIIAGEFPELDVMIGAHSHEEFAAVEINGILYTQAGAYGRNLGRLQLQFSSDTRKLISKRGMLLPANSDVIPDHQLAQRFQNVKTQTETWLNQTVGTAACEHSTKEETPGQSRIQSLISAAIAEAAQVDIVFHGTLSEAGISAGPIQMRDIWRVIPYENTIYTAQLTLEEIKAVLLENYSYFNTKQFRGVYGIYYKVQPPNTVELIKIAAKDVALNRKTNLNRRYTIAFNSFDAASAGARLPLLREILERPECELTDIGQDTRQAVVAYVKKHAELDVLFMPPIAGLMAAHKHSE